MESMILSGNDAVLSKIPLEILIIITLEYLTPREILNLCQTSQYFNDNICNNNYIWQQLYKRDISNNINNIKDIKGKYKQVLNDMRIFEMINIQLIYAAEKGYEKIVERLVKAGANVKYNDNDALIRAVKNNQLEVVKYLLSKGSNVNTQGDRPLMEAIRNGNIKMIKYLLEKGANIRTKGTEALFEAKDLETVKFLIINGIGKGGNYFLTEQTFNKKSEIINYLIDEGFNIKSYK